MKSATRAACCMLWVTITMVHCSFSPNISSSILAVAIGSSAEHGSSKQQHFGIDGQRPRDAQALLLSARKCVRRFVKLVLHFIPKRRPLQALLHLAAHVAPGRHAVDSQAIRNVVVDGFGERVGPLEDHADTPPQGRLHPRVRTSSLSSRICPSMRELRIVSLMRFRFRRNVDLPQPEGPISAVIRLVCMSSEISCSAWNVP